MPKYINADELEQNLKMAIAMMETAMNALDAEQRQRNFAVTGRSDLNEGKT